MDAAETVVGLLSLQVRPGHPDFLDLPWHLPLAEWAGPCARVVQLPRGLSRHEVLFVSYGPAVYALKELPEAVAEHEYDLLSLLEERRMPAVTPVGRARVRQNGGEEGGVLVTRFLDGALPYRTLFQNPGLRRYRDRLLDAMAGLLVRLHLAGFYWGDCSLSNTLFRRDAGELQAYLVDAETSEHHETLGDGARRQDLMILEENVAGDLADLEAFMELPGSLDAVRDRARASASATSAVGRGRRARRSIPPRRALAHPGSHPPAERSSASRSARSRLETTGTGDRLRMRTIVTDRDYHRHQFHGLTGLVGEERQAELMLNEMQRAARRRSRAKLDRSVPLSVAAFRWQRERFEPALRSLAPVLGQVPDPAEVYCQVLEHKWFLSERAKRDVGLEAAIADYVERFRTGP